MNNEIRNRIFNLREGCTLYNSVSGSTVYDDWHLPSEDELNEMYVNLHSEGVGGFDGVNYWSSSESTAAEAWSVDFSDGSQDDWWKSTTLYNVRACRTFISGLGAYSLKDIGPAGGLIFYIDGGTTYYEAAPSDQSTSHIWSNVGNAIGGTGTAIGTGQANTIAITGQAGHIDSAAKLCADYSIIV